MHVYLNVWKISYVILSTHALCLDLSFWQTFRSLIKTTLIFHHFDVRAINYTGKQHHIRFAMSLCTYKVVYIHPFAFLTEDLKLLAVMGNEKGYKLRLGPTLISVRHHWRRHVTLGLFQTSNFTWTKLNVNKLQQKTIHIYIEIATCEVPRFKQAVARLTLAVSYAARSETAGKQSIKV